MILFWVLGAALAAGALLLVMRPLLSGRGDERVSRGAANLSIYRDQLRELQADLRAGKLAQTDYDRARTELEARLLEDVAEPAASAAPRRAARGVALVVGTAIPVFAVALYLVIGNPAAIDREQPDQGISAQQLEAMAERLAGHLRENPDDANGWKLLGRSYSALGRFPEAVDAYAKAALRAPRDAQLLADFAEALAMARGRRLEGEPEKLVARALEIDPANLKALALAGSAAFGRRDYAAAAGHWEKMLPLVPADSEDARTIQASVDEARALQTAATKALKGTVALSPKLKAKVSPGDTVFIFARAVDGPPLPLAVLRAQARDLPISFSLDDSMAMAPGMKLSGFARVVVGARVSKSGEAAPRPGDLQGSSPPVANTAEGVSVVIDTVVR